MVGAIRDNLECRQRCRQHRRQSPAMLVVMEKASWRRACFMGILDKKFITQTREESLLQIKGLSDRKDKIMRESKIKQWNRWNDHSIAKQSSKLVSTPQRIGHAKIHIIVFEKAENKERKKKKRTRALLSLPLCIFNCFLGCNSFNIAK